MDRRETLRALLIGSVTAGVAATTATSCQPNNEEAALEASPKEEQAISGYGRTPAEKKRDAELRSETFFTPHELATIAVLSDIILPADERSGSATTAEVPDFIEFIVKDIPRHQLPMRGGLMWIDHEARHRFQKEFKDCTNQQQLQIVEEIAYPDKVSDDDDMMHGVRFFSLLRDLTLTGFYTSKIGVIDDLGYQGNVANVWDGVPEEVLEEHDVAYEPEWLAKCVDQSKRNEIAQWNEQGEII